MLSHNLPVKIEPQQNEAYNTKFKTNIVWKQLFKNPHLVNGNNWSGNAAYGTVAVADNKLTYTITTKNANQAITQPSISFTQNHIYLLSCWLTVSEDQVVGSYTGNSVANLANVKANVRTRIFNVFKSNITSTRTCYIYPARNGGLPIGGTAVLEDACLYDLTEMFGEGKEMLGRFSFLSNFPNNYYDYNVDGDPAPFTIPVYGGSINIKTGLLQITKYNIDLGYLYWQYSAAQASTDKYRKACTEVLFEATSSTSDVPDLVSSGYQTLSNAVSYQFTQGIAIATNSTIHICDERYSAQNDMPAFANAVKGITACGVMASPVTYNLTPVEVKTLLGNNKISSNATELQLTYKNSQNENVSLTGNAEYTIEDGVFNRPVLSATNLFSPKQNLNGQDYPWVPGCGKNRIDESIQYQPVPTKLYVGCHDDYTIKLPAGNYEFACRGRSTMYQAYIQKEGSQTAQAVLDNAPFDYMVDYATLTGGNYKFWFENSNGVDSTEIEWLNIQKDVTFDGNHYPYSNICPIEGYTESSITVEGNRVPDSESERRLKAITRPVFQWDFGLKLKFEGFTFADGTLCQFDNKITAYSLNATIENNECTIPYQLLDENCQGDIVAYINVSGNDYDVVVYEVYIPVIKRPKPENFLRPAIDLPSAVIASFADGADDVPLEKLKIAVIPKQDLHSYDYPWVAGGGKNKLNYDVWKTVNIQRGTAVWENNGVTLTATGNDCYTNYGNFPESARIPVKEGDVVKLSWEESTNKAGDCYIFSGTGAPHVHSNNAYSKSCQLTVGSGVTFVTMRMGVTNAGDTISYKNIMVQVNSSATTYAPYENICPITGYTEANVTRIGKNFFGNSIASVTKPSWYTGTWSGSSFNNQNGITQTRTYNDGGAGGFSLPSLPSGTYTISMGVFDATRTYRCHISVTTTGSDMSVVADNLTMTISGSRAYLSFTVPASMGVAVRPTTTGTLPSGTTSYDFTDIQIEVGSSATSYEPYKGQTYNVPFSFEGQNILTRVGETDNKYLNQNGVEASSTNYCITDYIEIEPLKRYVFDTISYTSMSSAVYHCFYDENKVLFRVTPACQEFFIPPLGAKYCRFTLHKTYPPTSIHIELGTVYKGLLDVKTGLLTVTHGFISDLSHYTYGLASTTLNYVFTMMYLTNGRNSQDSSLRKQDFLCSGYRPSSSVSISATMSPYSCLFVGTTVELPSSGRFYFRNDDYTGSSTDFRASMAGIQALYPFEENCIYQLTPTEVKTLLGYNNIWADTGEVEVSYYADPYLHFID